MFGGYTRAELKARGKAVMKRRYWVYVLTALILAFATGSFGGFTASTGSRTFTFHTNGTYEGGFHFGKGEFALPREFDFNAPSFGMPDFRAPEFSPVNAILLSTFIFMMVLILIAALVAVAFDVFLLKPLEVGSERIFICGRVEDPKIDMIGGAFSENYKNVVFTQFLRGLYIFLWSLLLIVPGIVKSYEYRMIPYILAENPDIDHREAFRLSRAMMDGQKWNAFIFDLSFIGWELLAVLTLGILDIFYVNPYRFAANTELYIALRDQLLGRPAAGGFAGPHPADGQTY